ncbi:hypothetical protein KW782_02890 [Candidatus Parcubacteria bacterium]|nr:hypothetical protein [Candidatus Parcubacteria bacterium]
MVPTVMIHDSDGEVMAPAGKPGLFVRGKRQMILVTALGKDEQTPLVVRQALRGMKISTIFTKEQLGVDLPEVPEGSRLAYASEVIEALEADGEDEAAESLRILAGNELDMYVFEPTSFTLIKQ